MIFKTPYLVKANNWKYHGNSLFKRTQDYTHLQEQGGKTKPAQS